MLEHHLRIRDVAQKHFNLFEPFSGEDVKNKAEIHEVIIKFLSELNSDPFNEKTGKKMFQKQGN